MLVMIGNGVRPLLSDKQTDKYMDQIPYVQVKTKTSALHPFNEYSSMRKLASIVMVVSFTNLFTGRFE